MIQRTVIMGSSDVSLIETILKTTGVRLLKIDGRSVDRYRPKPARRFRLCSSLLYNKVFGAVVRRHRRESPSAVNGRV